MMSTMSSRRPRSRRAALARLVAVSVASAVLLAACGVAGSLLPPALPARAPKGEIAVRVVRGSEHEALLVARVRIDGKGPFPFLIDTGAAISAINAPLAAALHLGVVRRRSGRLQGAGCTSASGTDRVTRWRVGQVSLPPIDVSTVHLSSSTSSDAIQGLLGSDLWYRFSSLDIDYRSGLVRLGVVPAGPSVAVRVVHQDGQVVVVAPVDVEGHGPYPFVVDTGASQSVVSQDLASTFHLHQVRRSVTIDAVGCTSKASMVQVGHWTSGAVTLPAGTALALRHPLGTSAPGKVGILGSNELSRFADVTVDYAAGRLILSH
jgi:predicted aspartyl protease